MQELSPKQSSEEYYIGFDFEKDLGDEDVDSAVVAAIDLADDSVVTSTLTDSTKIQYSGKIVYVWIRAGTTGHKYKITVKATGDGDPASIFELDAKIKVKDI